MNNTPPTIFLNSVKAVNDYRLLSLPLLPMRQGNDFLIDRKISILVFTCRFRIARPLEFSIVQALLQEYKSIPVKIEGFHRILFASTEQKDRIGERIHLEIVTDDCHESVKGFSHISPSCDQIDLLYSGQITDQSFRRADIV